MRPVRSASLAILAGMLVGAIFLNGCGSRQEKTASVSARGTKTGSRPVGVAACRERVARFRDTFSASPAANQGRRAAPPSPAEVRAGSTGFLVGIVEGVEQGPITQEPFPVKVEPMPGLANPPVMDNVSANLVIRVERAVGPSVSKIAQPGTRVGIPITVWYSSALHDPQVLADTARAATEPLVAAAPAGTRLGAYVTGLDAPKNETGVTQATTHVAAATVFQCDDGSLTSLDSMLTGDQAAAEFFGVQNLDGLVAEAQARLD